MLTAAQARNLTDINIAAAARAPINQVYNQIQGAIDQRLGQTIIAFTPFSFPLGGSTDPASAPFLNELAAGGFGLFADVDEAGTTRLIITW